MAFLDLDPAEVRRLVEEEIPEPKSWTRAEPKKKPTRKPAKSTAKGTTTKKKAGQAKRAGKASKKTNRGGRAA